MTTLELAYEQLTPGSTGFCIVVEDRCGFEISREEIARIAERAPTAADFVRIWETETWWREA